MAKSVRESTRQFLLANPGGTFTVADLAAAVYPDEPFTEAKRVAVQRAIAPIAEELGWTKRKRSAWGGFVRYVGPDAALADSARRAAFMRANKSGSDANEA